MRELRGSWSALARRIPSRKRCGDELCRSTLPIHRGPERHRLGGSKIILVRLPGRLLVKMDRHARLIGATRTNILNHLLERGLILYLRSQLAQAKTHHQALKTASAPDSSE